MTTDSQLSTTEHKKKKPKTNKYTTRTGIESQKWRLHGGLPAGMGESGEKGTENKKHKWQVQNRLGEVKNSIRNREAKELVCMTHGYELRGDCWRECGYKKKGEKVEKQDNFNSIINKIQLI